MIDIAGNLRNVQERIALAAERSGRTPESVVLVAVTKTFPIENIQTAIDAGARELGENRVQELTAKAASLSGARWHMIGHLQSNKAKDAARVADVVQSVDSPGLAERLARAAAARPTALEVMIEINVGNEPQKSGVAPDEAHRIAEVIAELPALLLTGLMTIPPVGDEPETRRNFKTMRELFDRLRRGRETTLRHLSMGMSDDYEIAIEEGATMVRVGRGIFGERHR